MASLPAGMRPEPSFCETSAKLFSYCSTTLRWSESANDTVPVASFPAQSNVGTPLSCGPASQAVWLTILF